MAPHSSTLAWKILWTEEPGRLQSMGSLRVGYDWVTSLSLWLWCIGEGNGNPLQCSCLENPRDGGAWWASVYGVAQSRTRLKWFSSKQQQQRVAIWWYLKPSDTEVLSHACPICICLLTHAPIPGTIGFVNSSKSYWIRQKLLERGLRPSFQKRMWIW